MQHVPNGDQILEKLVAKVTSSNLVALDMSLIAIKAQYQSYSLAASEMKRIGNRIVSAAQLVGDLLPDNERWGTIKKRQTQEELTTQRWLKTVEKVLP